MHLDDTNISKEKLYQNENSTNKVSNSVETNETKSIINRRQQQEEGKHNRKDVEQEVETLEEQMKELSITISQYQTSQIFGNAEYEKGIRTENTEVQLEKERKQKEDSKASINSRYGYTENIEVMDIEVTELENKSNSEEKDAVFP